MYAAPSASSDRLALTESALASADSLWRNEMRRAYGPDAVLTYGYAPEGQGGLGTQLRRSYEARRIAVALWRHERRPAATDRLASENAKTVIWEAAMAGTQTLGGETVAPPTVPIRGVDGPNPTTVRVSQGKEPTNGA